MVLLREVDDVAHEGLVGVGLQASLASRETLCFLARRKDALAAELRVRPAHVQLAGVPRRDAEGAVGTLLDADLVLADLVALDDVGAALRTARLAQDAPLFLVVRVEPRALFGHVVELVACQRALLTIPRSLGAGLGGALDRFG